VNTTDLERFIRDVPDFPKPGILFKDITPLLACPDAFNATISLLGGRLRDSGATEILAIESRGFLFGAALALHLGWPLHLVRKPGKLPRATIGLEYALEYGTDRIEFHDDVVQRGHAYAIVDDLIATGGTAGAVARLVSGQGGHVACCAFVVELAFLKGRDNLPGCRVESLIRYD
jgi:adenine phosphoribosyltransferase